MNLAGLLGPCFLGVLGRAALGWAWLGWVGVGWDKLLPDVETGNAVHAAAQRRGRRNWVKQTANMVVKLFD